MLILAYFPRAKPGIEPRAYFFNQEPKIHLIIPIEMNSVGGIKVYKCQNTLRSNFQFLTSLLFLRVDADCHGQQVLLNVNRKWFLKIFIEFQLEDVSSEKLLSQSDLSFAISKDKHRAKKVSSTSTTLAVVNLFSNYYRVFVRAIFFVSFSSFHFVSFQKFFTYQFSS